MDWFISRTQLTKACWFSSYLVDSSILFYPKLPFHPLKCKVQRDVSLVKRMLQPGVHIHTQFIRRSWASCYLSALLLILIRIKWETGHEYAWRCIGLDSKYTDQLLCQGCSIYVIWPTIASQWATNRFLFESSFFFSNKRPLCFKVTVTNQRLSNLFKYLNLVLTSSNLIYRETANEIIRKLCWLESKNKDKWPRNYCFL